MRYRFSVSTPVLLTIITIIEACNKCVDGSIVLWLSYGFYRIIVGFGKFLKEND